MEFLFHLQLGSWWEGGAPGRRYVAFLFSLSIVPIGSPDMYKEENLKLWTWQNQM